MSLHGSSSTGPARRRVLILGGAGSGHAELARGYATHTARGTTWFVGGNGAEADADDPRFEDGTWQRMRLIGDPERLVALITGADPDDTLVVDVDSWLALLLGGPAGDAQPRIDALVGAVRDAGARLLLVAHEAGMAAPAGASGRFSEVLARTNRTLAEACDEVVLVVAGQPVRLKPADRTGVADEPDRPGTPAGAAGTTPDRVVASAKPPVGVATAATGTGATATAGPAARPSTATAVPGAGTVPGAAGAGAPGEAGAPPFTLSLIDRPLPDDQIRTRTLRRLAEIDLSGAGFGRLEPVLGFAAAVQGTTAPVPFRSPRMLLLHGDDEGAAGTGQDPAAMADRVRAHGSGDSPLAHLAGLAAVPLRVEPVPVDSALERTTPLPEATVDGWLTRGAALADEMVDAGADLVVLGADGTAAATAPAVVVATATGTEVPAILPLVRVPGGYDDEAWMTRCVAVRDAVFRFGPSMRDSRLLLGTLAGPLVSTAVGFLLRATERRTPVLLDGPVGVAAALVARDMAAQSRHWLLLVDAGRTGLVARAADMLDLTPVLDAGIDLGEGSAALALLPLIQSALSVAGTVLGAPAGSPQRAAGATEEPGAAPDGSAGRPPRPVGTDRHGDTGDRAGTAESAGAEGQPGAGGNAGAEGQLGAEGGTTAGGSEGTGRPAGA